VRARNVVIAAGALERPLVFPGNDRPGVMLAGARAPICIATACACGSSAVVIVTADDAAYQTALELHAAGVTIQAIADPRMQAHGPWQDAAVRAGLPVQERTTVLGTRGRLRVSTVQLGEIDTRGDVRPTRSVPCDLVLMSGGYTPCVHLFSQSRGKLIWDEALQAFIPGTGAERERSAGACRGVYDLAAALQDGAAAGTAASHLTRMEYPARHTTMAAQAVLGALPAQSASAREKASSTGRHDVTTRDLALATREGFQSIEHVKRYTTTGMATDQGKTSNLNAMAIVAAALGKTIPEVGLTTFRMPYTPVTFGSLAGRRAAICSIPYARRRCTTGRRSTARYSKTSLWKRARYFPARQ
jgi:sarcosine oxidase subunit alpha